MNQPRPIVILIAYYFPPSFEIGARRPARFYKWLQRMGYRCHIVTATPQGDDCPADVSFVRDDTYELWEKGTGKKSLQFYYELLIRQLMFPGHLGIAWSRKAADEVARIADANPGERFVLFTTYPPVGTLLAGLAIHKRLKIPWIADFRDPFHALITKGAPRFSTYMTRRFEGHVFRKASAIIANMEPAAEMWRERYPWSREKLHVIYNGFDPEEEQGSVPIPPRDHKQIAHAGTFYDNRNIDTLVKSLGRLRARGESDAISSRFFLLGVSEGEYALDWELYRAAMRDGRVELHPRVSWKEADRIMAEADGLLMAGYPFNTVQVPAKLYSYICIGRPILALLLRSSQVETILQNAAVPSVCVYYDDPPEVVDRKLLEYLRLPNIPMPTNEWFRTNFNAQNQTEALAAIIDSVSRR